VPWQCRRKGSGRAESETCLRFETRLIGESAPDAAVVMEDHSVSRFGLKASRSFAVLDKSFLDGVSSPQFQHYALNGWTFGVTDALLHEHLRKRDARRIRNLFKLHVIQESIVRLPGIGEMFRSEARTLKPACMTMLAKMIELTPQEGPSGEYCELDGPSQRSTEERSRELKKRALDLVDAWQSLRALTDLSNASSKEFPVIIKELSVKIRNDRADMRGFYSNHRPPDYPPPELLDEKWTLFRWIQVQLLAGLDFIGRHGVNARPNEEGMIHELLDLDYLVPALLFGGLACRETRFVERSDSSVRTD
jgi:hypothetical protein